MPLRFTFYDISEDFTASQDDFDFDIISINATATKTCTLPNAWSGAGAVVTNSGALPLLINKPDSSTLLELASTISAYIFCYVDSSGVPQWAFAPMFSLTGVPSWGTSQTYTESNVTTDRTYDANATSTDELADVLGTLISDLRAKGIVA